MRALTLLLAITLSVFLGGSDLFAQRAVMPEVLGLTLVRADTGERISRLSDGDTVNLASLPTAQLNIEADVREQGLHELRFALNGYRWYRIERSAPYALAGDKVGDFNAWTPRVGELSIDAVPYSSQGTPEGKALRINLKVINDPTKEIEKSKPSAVKNRVDPNSVHVELSLSEPKMVIGSCEGNLKSEFAVVSIECSHYLKQVTSVQLIDRANQHQQAQVCSCGDTDLAELSSTIKNRFSCNCKLPARVALERSIAMLQIEVLADETANPVASGNLTFTPKG